MLRFIFREKANQRTFIAGTLLSVGVIALACVAWFFVLREHIGRLQQQEIGRIGRLISLDLVTTEDIPIILLESDYGDYEAGMEALRPFGYDEASSIFQDYQDFWLIRMSIYIGLGTSFVLVGLWMVVLALLSRKQYDFLRKVSSILGGVMSGQSVTDSELEYEGETAVVTSLLCSMSRRYRRAVNEVNQERCLLCGSWTVALLFDIPLVPGRNRPSYLVCTMDRDASCYCSCYSSGVLTTLVSSRRVTSLNVIEAIRTVE